MKNDVSWLFVVFFILAIVGISALAVFYYEKHNYPECVGYTLLVILLVFVRAVNFFLARWRKRKEEEKRPRTPAEIANSAVKMLRDGSKFSTSGAIAERAVALQAVRMIQEGDESYEALVGASAKLANLHERLRAEGYKDADATCLQCLATQMFIASIRKEAEQTSTEETA